MSRTQYCRVESLQSTQLSARVTVQSTQFPLLQNLRRTKKIHQMLSTGRCIEWESNRQLLRKRTGPSESGGLFAIS